MAPAANENTSDAGLALNYFSHVDPTLTSVGANLKDPLAVARAMIEHHRQQNDTEEKIAAIVRARQIEARKEQELDLARAIRRRHEDEQIQKQLLSIHRERELRKHDEGDLLWRSMLQRKQDELKLLRQDDTLLKMSQGGTRLVPLTSYENSLLSLPLSSQSSLLSSSSTLSSRTASFLEDQVSALHGRSNSQFNRTDFRNDRSQAILNSLYSSRPGSISPNQDLSSLRKFYEDITANASLDNMHANLSTSVTNLSSIDHAGAGAGADWLSASTGGNLSNASLMSISNRQQKRSLEGQDDLLVSSKRLKTGESDGVGSEQEEQQQKRFNKHQCKQWTLKFHELLAFKERMGHCNVPHGYKDNLALAMWVKRQRHQYNLMVEKKTSTLTGERIKLLENIGFVWNCLETAWEQHFQDLRHFVMRTGHCAVPSTYKRNPRLASWVVTQRRQCKLLEDGKQSSMTPKRLEKLKQIGFPVKTKKTGAGKNLKR